MEGSIEEFDAIVIGAGIMGSCAAYQIARRQRKVLLLEQFDFLHNRGSSHGESRTIRATYPESYYASMVIESYRLWTHAEAEIGYKVLYPTSQFDMGCADNLSLQSIINNFKSCPLTHQILDHKQVLERFSETFHIPEKWIGLCTELGGVIKPTKAVAMFHSLAMQNGAVLKDNMEVVSIKRVSEEDCIRVFTKNGGNFKGKKCIITVGAWTKKLVKAVRNIDLPIQPLHTTISYWKIKEEFKGDFSIESGFPSFSNYQEPYIYGTPSLEFPELLKISIHGGYPCDPDNRKWTSYKSDIAIDKLREWIAERFKGKIDCVQPVFTQSCMYSMTPDEDFLIDFLGGEFGKDVVVAGGFSGHGFKMGPVVGRVLADLILEGKAEGVELHHFRASRFQDNPKGNVKVFENQVASNI